MANKSLIIGLATLMRPMPPVASRVDVEKSSQNWGVFITVETSTLAPPAALAGGVYPAGR